MRVTDAAGRPMAGRVVATRSLLRRFSRAADVIARSTTGPRQPTTAALAGRIGVMSRGLLTREMEEKATGRSVPEKVVPAGKLDVSDRLTGSDPWPLAGVPAAAGATSAGASGAFTVGPAAPTAVAPDKSVSDTAARGCIDADSSRRMVLPFADAFVGLMPPAAEDAGLC